MDSTLGNFELQVSGENKICNKFDESIAKINNILTLIDNLKIELNKGNGPIVQTHIASLSAIYSEFSNIVKAIEEKKESILTNAQNCESVYQYCMTRIGKSSFKVTFSDGTKTIWTLRSVGIDNNGEIKLWYEGLKEYNALEQILNIFIPSAGDYGITSKTISGDDMVNNVKPRLD